MTDQHPTTTRAVPSGYDLEPEQHRPDAPSPAPGRPSPARPSLARDFGLLALGMAVVLACIAVDGLWLGLVFGP